ncbi:MAG: zinc-binding dehydrogenase, partial [Pseudomonadota bacterium]
KVARAGGVGLNSVQAARISGAARIFAIDVKPEKLAVAEAFGATDRVNAAQGDPVAAVRKATRGFGVDYVFVTAGVKAAVDQAMRMVARGGAVVLVGMPPNGVLCDIDPGTIANDCVRIIGSKMGAANIHTQLPALMDLHAQGCLQLAPLISNRFAFDEINAAMASSMGGAAIRNVMTF